jgi:hypothetical protein
MSALCSHLHELTRRGTRFSFPFKVDQLLTNGIYVLFEKGETAHGGERITRVGTHNGDGQLPARMCQHFVNENKDRSILRKNIGSAFLNQANDPFLEEWKIDLTTRKARQHWAGKIDSSKLEVTRGQGYKIYSECFQFCSFSR